MKTLVLWREDLGLIDGRPWSYDVKTLVLWTEDLGLIDERPWSY